MTFTGQVSPLQAIWDGLTLFTEPWIVASHLA